MVDDYGVYQVVGRLHVCDGVEKRRATVDRLEMWMVVLADGHCIVEDTLTGICHLEVEGVGSVDITHWYVEAVGIFLHVDEDAVHATLGRRGDGHGTTCQLLHFAVQLVLGIDRVVEWAVECAASHHRQDGE